jgi:hypothetical protein
MESSKMSHGNLAKCVLAFAITAAVPSFCLSSAFAAPPNDPTQPVQQSSARDQAIYDCSVEASKWSFSTWQSTQIITYQDCMAAHGQPE